MNLKRTLGVGLVGLGVLLTLAGLAMPATRTETARTCYDSVVQYGQNCVETSYQAPTGKGAVLGGGFASLLIGAVLWHVGRDTATGRDSRRTTGDRSAPTDGQSGERRSPRSDMSPRSELTPDRRDGRVDAETLAEQVERHDSGERPADDTSSRAAESRHRTDESPSRTDESPSWTDESPGRAATAAEADGATREELTPNSAESNRPAPASQDGRQSEPSGSDSTRATLAVAGQSAGVAVVGGLSVNSVVGLLVGTAPGGVAWLAYVASGLGAVALWRRRTDESTANASPSNDQ
ncbi:hypothetical protein M0R89_09920 [Halorussus limi]|uniref:Uncharacterized protein n=1 Tax=Halorussus limi TaxID=2938695 RepID=A0A8U0HQ52_9EURY|nr:hypothetical protein [Halorussus limi]UPV72866.1 hypothetical protein M0R89_09920 [Halorussus limi]